MIEIKKDILKQIYRLYDEITSDYSFACSSGCSSCCTRNVSVTSLESFIISEAILSKTEMSGKTASEHNDTYSDSERDRYPNTEKSGDAIFRQYIQNLEKTVGLPRYIPETTANSFASIMMSGEDAPEEILDPSWKPCPFLGESGLCVIYESRPFHCRCMHSEEKCGENGYSVMPPFLVTINNVFLQYIEHIDKTGFVANITDAVLWMMDLSNRHSYSGNILNAGKLPDGFIGCRPMPFLMVPPEHQERVRPVIKRIAETGQGMEKRQRNQ